MDVFLNLFSYSSIALQCTATEQIELQSCALLWLCGCKSFFKSEKLRKERARAREEEMQFTATSLSMCKNKLYSIDAVFSLTFNLENSLLNISSSVVCFAELEAKKKDREDKKQQIFTGHLH